MLSAGFSILFGCFELALLTEQTNSMVISEAMRAHLLNLGGSRPVIISSVYLPDLVWYWYGSGMVYLPDRPTSSPIIWPGPFITHPY